ncbi:MAG: LysR family transcriptional regulator [Comamonadaceae bacterium]|nr:MAG: LysR family transcriptional regulator [Comamonadaceae bacterium]
MDVRHLRNFVALAEELHFGRAAARLSMTQPPLSASIMQLEDEVGARLFDRDRKKVVLTAVGEAFYPEARRTLASLARAQEVTDSVARGRIGRLTVGYSPSMLYRQVPELLRAYVAQNPGVDLVLHEGPAAHLVESLQHGLVDAAFVNMTLIPEGLEGLAFSREELVFCIPANHALARAKSIRMQEFVDELFVMCRRESSPANYDSIVAVCRAGGIEPKIRYAASNWMSMVALVANGFGVAVVPRSLANCGIANAVFIPMKEATGWAHASFLWSNAHNRPTLPALVSLVQRRAV